MNDFFEERIRRYSHLLAVIFSGVDTTLTDFDADEQLREQIFSAFDCLLKEIMAIVSEIEKAKSVQDQGK